MSSGANQPTLGHSTTIVPEVITEADTIVPEVDNTEGSPDHEASEDKQSEQDDTSKELVEDADGSTHNDGEVEFVKKPGEFTTEVFKIEIRNLPRYSGYKVSVEAMQTSPSSPVLCSN